MVLWRRSYITENRAITQKEKEWTGKGAMTRQGCK
jgi:hypothetical protein